MCWECERGLSQNVRSDQWKVPREMAARRDVGSMAFIPEVSPGVGGTLDFPLLKTLKFTFT